MTLSFDETTTIGDVDTLFKVFAGGKNVSIFSMTLWLHDGLLLRTMACGGRPGSLFCWLSSGF